ncbi:MAG: type IX secretion system sortase PorU, partial [Bacteroidales bacterium]|nr:type IX secretion system sortase PorU [Bacteroidales bacterium]
PIALKSSFTNGNTQFSADCSTLHEFIAFSKDFKSVNFEKIIDNQDILKNSNIDMLIIANPMFNEQANRLAQLHTTFDKFTCAVVSQEEICTEFAAGRKDVAALRDYIRYIYIRGGKKLKYVLLFGDGTFANKTIDFNGPYIFTFQTKETLNEDYSLCSDDFFGLLDKNSGVKSNDTFVGELKVAIGRLPVTTKSEAEHITDKIIQYSTNPLYRGDWQNYLCFLADDANENQTTHMNDADLLCTSITKSYPQFNFDKIYADAYKQVRSSAGERYPDVVKAINDRIQKGCLIFNYSGHGNETRMMAEYAVEATSVESWKNTTKLPFFIAAACNIAHFDYNGTSLGEKLLTQKNGGGIGIISATRYSYASANYTLCDNIYKYIFDLDTLQQPRTIGEAFLLAKANTANDMYQNKRVYILLGDPALRLAVPKYSIAIDSINNIPFAEFNDTIKALSTLQISGHIETPDAQIDDKYDGILSIKLFDKSQSITTLGNDKNDVITFDSYTNTLFQGMASVQNGRFSFSAILPQDIYYYNGKGKLSLYATNDSIQAAGAFYDLLINESLTSEDDDFSGPTISMYLNEKNFTNGSMTNQNPTLRIFVTDSSGINISNAS